MSSHVIGELLRPFRTLVASIAANHYFQVLLSNCVSAVLSQVMKLLLVSLIPAVGPRLLPGVAVALRVGDVVPRHVLPPSLAEACRAKACGPMPIPALVLGCLAALIPGHGAPSSLTSVVRHGVAPRRPRTASLALIPRHGKPPRRVPSPCLAESRDVSSC